MTFKDITFAMDLSLNGPGFAVLAVTDGGFPVLLEKSHLKPKGTTHGRKLGQISEEIDRYLCEYSPEHIVREKGFSRFAATTQALYKTVGVSDLYAYMRMEKTVHEIAPTSVKKIVAGNGKASKDDVQEAVIRRLQIDKPDFFANDDESDACAVGVAYFIQKGLVDA